MIRQHPILLGVLVQIGLFAVTLVLLWTNPTAKAWSALRASMAALLVAMPALLIWGVASWISYPSFTDHAEPTFAATAYLFFAGNPLYPALDAGPLYANNYGPSSYWLIAGLYWLLGPSVLAAKLYGLVCLVGALAMFFFAMARSFGGGWAIASTLLLVGYFLRFEHISYWVRPDPFLILLVTAGLLAATIAAERPRAAACAIGFMAGIASMSKVHGAAYFLPLALMHPFSRRFASNLLWLAVPFAGAAILAFTIGDVSLDNYIDWILVTGAQGLTTELGTRVLEEALWMGLPVLVLYLVVHRDFTAAARREHLRLLIGTLVAFALIGIPATKPGAGPHHLLPFAPIVLYLAASLLKVESQPNGRFLRFEAIAAGSLVLAVVASVALVAAVKTIEFTGRLGDDSRIESALNELKSIQESFQGCTLAVSYGDGETKLSYLRVVPVFKGQPYLFDAPSIAELRLAGKAIPQSSVDLIESGSVEVYLFPKGTLPFETLSPYSVDGSIGMGAERPRLFDEPFVDAFRRNYVLERSEQFFDVWRLRPAPGKRSYRGRESLAIS